MDYVNINSTSLYRLLIANLRYCYTRNNHLEPSCSYNTILNEILPLMLEADSETAIHTAKQLCEECITDEIGMHFYYGEDDEFGNRKASIDFVKELLDFIHKADPDYVPYCYDSFIENTNHDDDKVYNIYEELPGQEKILLNKEKLSVKEYLDYLIVDILNLTDEEQNSGIYYNKQYINNSFYDEKAGEYKRRFPDFRYKILDPVNRTFYVENTRNELIWGKNWSEK